MSGGNKRWICIYGRRRGRLVKVVVRFRVERGKRCIEIWEYEGFRDSFTDEVFWRGGMVLFLKMLRMLRSSGDF